MSTEEFQRNKDHADDESDPQRFLVLGREMGSEKADRLDIVLQHGLFLLVRRIVATTLTFAIEDLVPVERAQEGQDEEAWYFLRGPAFEPFIGLRLLLRTNAKNGEACGRPGSDATGLGNCMTLAVAVTVSHSAPNAIAIANATGRDASATSWAALVTFHFSDPVREMSFDILFRREYGAAITHLQVRQPDFTLVLPVQRTLGGLLD
ncbi:hypothetical protein MMC11_006482 [Xylographa trunciseda]|nr:hypothetical protein [Xylographa trunciseda]